MLAHEFHGFRNVAEVGGVIGAQAANVLGSAHRLFNFRSLAGREVKGQSHDFEREKKIGEDDGRIDPENLGRFNGDLGRDLRLLTDLNQGILLADGAVLRHIASSLAHEPDRRALRGLSLGGANKQRVGGRHEPSNLASLGELEPK